LLSPVFENKREAGEIFFSLKIYFHPDSPETAGTDENFVHFPGAFSSLTAGNQEKG